jgi:hypothetical protein
MTKRKGQTTQRPREKDKQHLVIVLLVLFSWSLCCVSFSLGHCVVCPFLLVIVLLVLFSWSLCCGSFSLGHCVAGPFLLVIVLLVLFSWSLCCWSFSLGHCVAGSFLLVIVLLQHNDQEKRTSNTMTKRKGPATQ